MLGLKNRTEERDRLDVQMFRWAGLTQQPSNSNGAHHKIPDLIGLSTFSQLFIFAAGKKKKLHLTYFPPPPPPLIFQIMS